MSAKLRVRLERDSWILMQALDPDVMPQRIRDKNAGFDDPETRRQRAEVREAGRSRISEASPAWQRIIDALTHRASQRRTARHDS